tara:strand:- start:316 stop:1068 length:753 start_codon:yes stop_codon:yes gene_type:complete
MIKSNHLLKYKFIKHSFFNRNGGVSKGIYRSLNCGPGSKDKKKNINRNLNIVAKKIGCKKNKIILLNQIHSNKFYFIKNKPNKKLKGDGLITNKKKLALGILTADCAPVIIIDPEKKIISNTHVGWRGAYKKIISKVVNSFIKKGSNPNKLVAVIGPCIGKNNYEVKNDFKKKFLKKDNLNIKFFKNLNKKIYFNLSAYIRSEMVSLGVKSIEIINKDTFPKKNNFFSSRNSLKNHENDYGRNLSIIMIK